jgi:hypothetical protein
VYGLVAEYGTDAVDKALGRALSYGARDIRIIRNILEGKLYELTDTVTPATLFDETSNSRDLWYYEQAVRGIYTTTQANTGGTPKEELL